MKWWFLRRFLIFSMILVYFLDSCVEIWFLRRFFATIFYFCLDSLGGVRAQATGQKRPNVGQLSWPITVPITGMLRQFPGAGNFFQLKKKNLGAPVFDPAYPRVTSSKLNRLSYPATQIICFQKFLFAPEPPPGQQGKKPKRQVTGPWPFASFDLSLGRRTKQKRQDTGPWSFADLDLSLGRGKKPKRQVTGPWTLAVSTSAPNNLTILQLSGRSRFSVGCQ